MPSTRQTGHRLRAGTFTSSGITSTYAIESWSVQSDQIATNQVGYPWIAPYQAIAPDYARVTDSADLTTIADGFLEWTWTFSYWTFGMFAYFMSTFFSSTLYSATRSTAISAMAYDVNDVALYLNANLKLPKLGTDFFKAEMGGYRDIKLSFSAGKIVS